jgi:hypothetical protein
MFNAVFVGKAHVMTQMIRKEDKKFWEEMIAYISLMRHGQHRKLKKSGGRGT